MSKWEMVSLGSIGDFKSGGTPSRSKPEFFQGEIPWITTVSLGKLYIDESDAVDLISQDAINNSATKLIAENSIMVGIRVGVGKVSINKVPMATNQDIVSIENINEKLFYKSYVVYRIKSLKAVMDISKRGATIQGISGETLKSLLIPRPPLEVQKQIAKSLDTAAELLAMRKQQFAELDNLIKSTFYEIIGDFYDYELLPLIDLIVDGAGLSYGIVQPGDDVGEGIGIIRPVDIEDGTIRHQNIKRIPSKIEQPYKKTRLTGNEILITVRGTTGDTALTDERFVGMNVTRGIAVIRQNDNVVNKIFLNEYLKSDESKRYIQENTKGATLRQINLSALKEQLIPLPPLSVQNKFASIVTKIEEQKALVKKAIDETQLLFDSLMSQYFDD